MIKRVDERQGGCTVEGTPVVKGGGDVDGCFIHIRDTKVDFSHDDDRKGCLSEEKKRERGYGRKREMAAKWSAPKAGHERGRLVSTDPKTPQKKNRRGERKETRQRQDKRKYFQFIQGYQRESRGTREMDETGRG